MSFTVGIQLEDEVFENTVWEVLVISVVCLV